MVNNKMNIKMYENDLNRCKRTGFIGKKIWIGPIFVSAARKNGYSNNNTDTVIIMMMMTTFGLHSVTFEPKTKFRIALTCNLYLTGLIKDTSKPIRVVVIFVMIQTLCYESHAC